MRDAIASLAVGHNWVYTALPGVMRYKKPTPNPLPASDEGAKMYLIRA